MLRHLIRTTLAATALGLGLAQAAMAADANVRFTWWGSEERAAKTLQVIKLFEEKNPGIKIKAEYAAYEGYQARLSTQFAGGVEPDIMQVLLAWVPMFSKSGDGFADVAKFSGQINMADFPKGAFEEVTVNGKIQGVPIGSTGFIFLYNKDTWEKAGLAYPKTWDELFAAAKTMQDKLGPGYYPIDPAIQGSVLISLSWAMQQHNVGFIDATEPKVAMTEAQIADWLRFFKRLEDERVMVSIRDRIAMGGASKPTSQMPNWVDGKWGGVYSQDGMVTVRGDTLPRGAEQLEVGPYVTLPGAKTTGTMARTGYIYAISKHSKNQEAAAKFINFLTTDPEAARIVGMARGTPASKTQWKELVDNKLIPQLQITATGQIMEMGEKGQLTRFSIYFEHPLMYKLLFETFEQLSFDKITPEEGAKKLMAEATKILSKF